MAEWSDDDVKILNEMRGSKPKDIAARLGRSASSIRWKLKQPVQVAVPSPAPVWPVAHSECQYLSGDTKPYKRCHNKVWRGVWCEEHWKAVHHPSSRGYTHDNPDR
jgi:hypothetical protein